MISTAYRKSISVWQKNIPELSSFGKLTKNPENISDIPWVNEGKAIELVIDYIIKHYEVPNTRKGHISALRFILDETKFPEIAKQLKEMFNTSAISVFNTELETKKDEKELKYGKTYVELQKIQRKLYKTRNDSFENNMIFLTLSLYLDTPPIRTEYSDMDVLFDDDFEIGETENVINIYSGGQIYLYINDDKVSNIHDILYYRLPKKLTKYIYESLQRFPRDKLIQATTTNSTMSKNQFHDLLNKISPHMGVCMLRSAYTTHFYKQGMSLKAKNVMAKKMRNSVNTAELSYNKID